MTPQELIELSRFIELALVVIVTPALSITLVILGVRLARRNAVRPIPLVDALEGALTRRREVVSALSIMVCGGLLRIYGWAEGLTSPWWFSAVEPLDIDSALHGGDFLARWVRLFGEFHPRAISESALLFPIGAFFQHVFGPSAELPTLIGGIAGTVAIALVWQLGRGERSKLFGLLLAGLFAVSPMQIVWARTGGVAYVGAVYFLIIILAALHAGRRQSIVCSIFAAVLTWGSLYLYYGVRLAFPLAPVALLVGARLARVGRIRQTVLISAFLGTLVALYVVLPTTGIKATFWPFVPGYAGNKGESSLRDLLERNVPQAVRESRRILLNYFFIARVEAPHDALARFRGGIEWGIDRGGLTFLPIGVLGLIGFVSALRHPVRNLLWLALAVLSFLIVAMSLTASRRLLGFDFAWNAFAALGILSLLRLRILCPFPARSGATVIALGMFLLGLWSFSVIVVLNRAIPKTASGIPFAQGFYGDGWTCRACYERGKDFEAELAQGNAVVLFDSDRMREHVTCPGGLGLYGRLAALKLGRSSAFFEFYPIWKNLNYRFESGSLYDASLSARDYLVASLRSLSGGDIVWHFEVPTQWEEELAERLVAVGGKRQMFSSPLSRTRSFRVTTPRSSLEKAIAVLGDIERPSGPRGEACLQLTEVSGESFPGSAIALGRALHTRDDTSSAVWIVSTGDTVHFKGRSLSRAGVIAFAEKDREDGGGGAMIELLRWTGAPEFVEVNPDTLAARELKRRSVLPVGTGCAVFLRDEWWVVDPVTGDVRGTGDTGWLPSGHWIGISSRGEETLVLASRSGEVVTFRLDTHTEELRFHAEVFPSFERDYGECIGIGVGRDWYATANFTSGLVAFYNAKGQEIAVLSLPRLLNLTSPKLLGIAASDNLLGVSVGFDHSVRTFELAFAHDLQACQSAPREVHERAYAEPSGTLLLGGLHPITIEQEWGVPRANRTVSNELLRVGGKTYRRGFGVHARSLLRFRPDGRFSRFESEVGLPDYIPPVHPASVVFEVRGDGKILWNSGTVRIGDGVKHVSVDISGVHLLELIVTDSGDGIDYDHGCWLNPRLE